jgi:ribosomal protein L29
MITTHAMRRMSRSELTVLLKQYQRDLVKTRFSIRQLKLVHQVALYRRAIARILTILTAQSV